MRSLLELHYDDWHFQRWKAKRRGEFKVFNSIAQGVLFPLLASFLPLSLLLSSLLSASHAKTASQPTGSGSAPGFRYRKPSRKYS